MSSHRSDQTEFNCDDQKQAVFSLMPSHFCPDAELAPDGSAGSPDIESDGSSAADLTVKSGATTTRGVSGTAEMVGKWALKGADTRGQRWHRQVGNHDEWFSTAGEYFLPQTT